MSTQIDVVIYSIDQDNIYILSTSKDKQELPFIRIDEESIDKNNLQIDNYVAQIIDKYTNMDHGWLNTKLIDVVIYNIDNNLSTHIYYACYIPFVSKISGEWTTIDKKLTDNKIIKKILCLR